MPQNTTPYCMTPAKQAAFERLIVGDTVTQAATVAGVSRETVHRWLREDHHFRAAYNASRRELVEASRTILLAAAIGAAQNVSAAVVAGDMGISVSILKGLGVLGGKEPALGSDNAAQLDREFQEGPAHDELMAELMRPIRMTQP